MKFIVSRTSEWSGNPKVGGAKIEELTYLDARTVKSLEEARAKPWSKEWFESGANHREEGGLVVRDVINEKHTLEIKTLKALVEFVAKYGDIVIQASGYKEVPYEIEVYDGYRE